MADLGASVGRGAQAQFNTTHWSVVLAAGDGNSTRSFEALETLCQVYWYPLYVYVRRRGFDEHDAKDLVQGFFAQLLDLESLRNVSMEKGRFRSFLLASLNHFLADERDRAGALKRGGGNEIISFDADQAEDRYQREPVDHLTPDKIFDRRWALCVLDRTFAKLEREFGAKSKAKTFARLRGFLLPGAGTGTLAEAAQDLSLSEEAAKKRVQRIRHRCQQIFRDEIAQTVASAAQVDEELRHLAAIMADH